LTKKIFKSIMAVCTVVLVLGLAFVMGILYRYFGKQISTELEKEASYVAQGVELSGVEYLEKLNGKNARITLIDQDGSVLYDSQAEASSMENHGDREDLLRFEADRWKHSPCIQYPVFGSGACLSVDCSSTLDFASYDYSVRCICIQTVKKSSRTCK